MLMNTAQLFQTSALLAASGPLTQYRGMVQTLYTTCKQQPEMHLGEIVATGTEFRMKVRNFEVIPREARRLLIFNIDEALMGLEQSSMKQTGELFSSQLLIDSLITTLALPKSNDISEIDRHAREIFHIESDETPAVEDDIDTRQTREMTLKTIQGMAAAIEAPAAAIQQSIDTYIVDRGEDEVEGIEEVKEGPFSADITSDEKGYLLRLAEHSGEQHPSNFHTLKWLASGGEGHAYLATQHLIGNVERTAVLKIIHLASRQQAAMTRFENEVRLLKDNPPGAIQIYGAGHTSTGAPFLAMEYAEEGTLTQYFFNKAHSMEAAINILRDLIHRVATSCHARGIVHRDIKPDNYLVLEDGTIKLADFGIALRLSEYVEPKKEDIRLNCTLEYASYEAIYGYKPDPRQDVYSLGAMLYELLTGELPYPRTTGQSPLSYISHRIMETDPPKRPRKLNPKIPVWLDQLIMRALSHDPEDRHQDAAEMLADFVTHKARELEHTASQGKRRQRHSQVPMTYRESRRHALAEQRRIENQWEKMMSTALREYEEAYRRYELAPIRDKIIELNFRLWEYADRNGIDRLIQATSRVLLRELDNSDERYQRVAQNIDVQFKLDGRLSKSSSPRVILAHAENIGGDLSNFHYPVQAIAGIPKGYNSFKRGGAHRFTLIANDYMPVSMPLPARPGRFTFRVPAYPMKTIPKWARKKSLLIPAGSVAVWTGQSSYSAAIPDNDVRHVPEDYLLHPLITNGDWNRFLLNYANNHGIEAALRHVPYDANGPLWRWDETRNGGSFVDRVGMIPDPDLPIYNIHVTSALEFMTREMPGAVLPTLDQLKLPTRGVDLRKWGWGNADPDHGEAAHAIIGEASEPVPVSEPMLDSSPYSVVDENGHDIRRINHMVGNVERFFQVPKDHQDRMFRLFRKRIEQLLMKDLDQLTDQEKDQLIWTFGAAYDTQPRNPEMIRPYRRDTIGKIGLMPVYNLGRP